MCCWLQGLLLFVQFFPKEEVSSVSRLHAVCVQIPILIAFTYLCVVYVYMCMGCLFSTTLFKVIHFIIKNFANKNITHQNLPGPKFYTTQYYIFYCSTIHVTNLPLNVQSMALSALWRCIANSIEGLKYIISALNILLFIFLFFYIYVLEILM